MRFVSYIGIFVFRKLIDTLLGKVIYQIKILGNAGSHNVFFIKLSVVENINCNQCFDVVFKFEKDNSLRGVVKIVERHHRTERIDVDFGQVFVQDCF